MWEEAEGEQEQEGRTRKEKRSKEYVWHVKIKKNKTSEILVCRVVGSLLTSLCCAAHPGLWDHVEEMDSSLPPCSPAGADGAPGVGLRLPASSI